MTSSPYSALPSNPESPAGTLIRLRGLFSSLKAALRKAADVTLARPELAIYASVNEVAAAAGVSEATVMRLPRLLGFRGFQDFQDSPGPGNGDPLAAPARRGGRGGRHRHHCP